MTETASYHPLLDLLEDGVALLDAQGTIVRANRALARILGRSRHTDLTGVRLLEDLNVGPMPTGEILDRLYRNGEIRHVETELLRCDGKRAVVLLSARAVHSADQWPVAYEMVCTDITDRAWLEQRWRGHERLLIAGTVAGGLAVDVQQLAAAAAGYHDLLTSAVDDPHALGDLSQLRRTVETLDTVSRQLLAFCRPRVVHPTRIHIGVALEELDRALQETLCDDVNVVMNCTDLAGEIAVDRQEFIAVLSSLAAAACEEAHGGTLRLAAETTYLDATFSREHLCTPPGHYVMVAISTGGCSEHCIATSDWKHEQFFAPDMLDATSGVALAAAYAFAKYNGGHLTVRRGQQPGTTFKIYLPRAPRTTRRPTILVVEDEAGIRGMARRLLEYLGYPVLEAPDAEEALWLAARHREPIDLLLADVMLPGMGAQELADRLQATRPGIRVLFMSGLLEPTLIERGLLRGGTPFIEKPFTSEEIQHRLDALLTREDA